MRSRSGRVLLGCQVPGRRRSRGRCKHLRRCGDRRLQEIKWSDWRITGKRRDYSLCKSPLQAMAKLHPACFESAWSMWSRKPMPVLMLIVCDVLACVACPSSLRRRLSVSGGKAPPSRLSASWILVSLVSREKAAQRGGCAEAIVSSLLLSRVLSKAPLGLQCQQFRNNGQ
jgi:hypothetical protein